MVKPIFQLIDTAYHEIRDKHDRANVAYRLMSAAPAQYLTLDGFPNDKWMKAVRKYMDELDKVQEWNKVSLNFNKR